MTTEGNSPILSLRNIQKSYGPIQVLHGIDMDFYAGEVVALLGENGAGKSTVSNVISGTIRPTSGTMTWQGAAYAPATPKEAIDSGVGMIHQELMLLPHLTIAENIFVGRYPKTAGRVDRRKMEERAHEGLERLGLDISPRRVVEGLSTANQQLIEIAKALTLNAKLLILDEPTAALGGAETKLLFKQIEKLKSEGVGIVYISHRLEEIKQIADRIVVMRDGEKVKEFDSADIPIRTIVEAMVGRSLGRMFPNIPTPSEETVLEVRDLSSPHGTFAGVNFAVKKGEIFGVAGLVGAGRTELVRAIAGADPIETGQVLLGGTDITPRTPRAAIDNGIVLVPEDRKLQGVILNQSIQENIAYANFESVGPSGWVRQGRVRQFANENIRKFGVKGQGHQNASEMSGGNQQKVVIAKWLARNPRVVLLDEPTRGIDVGARSSIYDIIVGLAEQGVAVIVVSSDLDEVLGVSNRIMVMAAGRQTGILDRSEANDVYVMELATSGRARSFDQKDLITPIKQRLEFVFIPKVVHPWYEVVAKGAEKAVEELKRDGIDVRVTWDWPPKAQVADHNRRIMETLERKPDGVAVACLDPVSEIPTIQKAVDEGVNVITFDTFCSDAFPFVGNKSDRQDGAELGEFLAARIGGAGKVAILAGSPTATNHAARVAGFKEAIAAYPDIDIVYEEADNDNPDTAVRLTEAALAAHPDLAGIFGCDASNPIGAARAVSDAGRAGEVVIVGMDDLQETLKYIEAGVIAGVKAQRQWEIGYWTVKNLVAMNQNHTVPHEHLTGSQMLTKAHLADWWDKTRGEHSGAEPAETVGALPAGTARETRYDTTPRR
ncbi:ATP-binding cassette domain-containing protein [Tropicimonas isoalkanivorans]|uniref:ABC-type sugar transport system, ATPase component n=1 Tax=Tropicimonas isoalkanivorans TaxID=441112 RepID=A0A1I1QE24_9RHOB|nr:ATP-binding cassette domain-containing protein [Tropicimonas isoalkanivorans]SFD17483.1 ABC-type sugar transport system, ATPase component [Tropicimonas isoalkanivorans]